MKRIFGYFALLIFCCSSGGSQFIDQHPYYEIPYGALIQFQWPTPEAPDLKSYTIYFGDTTNLDSTGWLETKPFMKEVCFVIGDTSAYNLIMNFLPINYPKAYKICMAAKDSTGNEGMLTDPIYFAIKEVDTEGPFMQFFKATFKGMPN